jgi:hypothetical protein
VQLGSGEIRPISLSLVTHTNTPVSSSSCFGETGKTSVWVMVVAPVRLSKLRLGLKLLGW